MDHCTAVVLAARQFPECEEYVFQVCSGLYNLTRNAPAMPAS